MAKKKSFSLRFPTGGVVKRFRYQDQKPYTTPSALNVWPVDVVEGRERGGMRPGLAKTHAAELGSGSPVRLLASFTWVDTSDDNARVEAAIASAGDSLYKEVSGNWSAVSTSLTLNSNVLLQAAIHEGKVYIADYGLAAQGTDGTTNASPGTTFDSASLADWTTIGANADDYVLVVTSGTGVTAGTYEIASISSGSITLSSSPGASGSDINFRIERAPKVYDPSADTLSLYLADTDQGTAPTGCKLICNYRGRIVLAGDPVNPQQWYMSRLDSPDDWLYGDTDVGSATSAQNAEIGFVGEPITALAPHGKECLLFGCEKSFWILRGDPMFGGTLNNLSRRIGIVSGNAWCKTPSDETIFLSQDGLYAMAAGCGSVPQGLSRQPLPEEMLHIDPDAIEPLLAYDLLHRSVHVWLTKKTSGPSSAWMLHWDGKAFSPMSTSSDYEPTAICVHEPVADADVSDVLLGGRDGYVRSFDKTSGTDDGTNFDSHIMLGPLAISSSYLLRGHIQFLQAVLEDASGNVDWEIRTSDVDEDAVTRSADYSGEWTSGVNPIQYPRRGGRYATIKLIGHDYSPSDNVPWIAPEILMVAIDGGRRRPG